ncbi:MAG: DUF4249 family protein [Prevotella sp.]|nr:DUF4249 family protein [Prevotella sp.]
MKKRIQIMICCAAALLCACSNEMDIEVLNSNPKMVLYCFPNTEHDTTIINLSASVPVAKKTRNTSHEQVVVSNPRIIYRVNGEERMVSQAGENTDYVPKNSYYVVGANRSGDRISIEVSAEGYADIHAETVIPDMPDVAAFRNAIPVRRDDMNYDQYRIALNSDPASDDYYAVSADFFCNEREVRYDELNDEWQEYTVYSRHGSAINVDDEPALNPISTLDDFFEYDNAFYNDFYIFNDNLFNGSQYTLRLNMSPLSYAWGRDIISYGYVFKIYKISQEYYRFIKSLNDVSNNWLGEYGLAPLSPTLNNVAGGLGVVGGYSVAEHAYSYEPDYPNQSYLYE